MSTKVLEKIQIPILERREHQDLGLEIPYYDEEFDLPHLKPHRIAVTYLGYTFDMIAKKVGLEFISDQPVWYIHPATQEQKTFYPDAGFANYFETKELIASDLVLAAEVVSTSHKPKEKKDRKGMKKVNEYNYVPEFVLFYPNKDDDRVIEWYVNQGGAYQLQTDKQGIYQSNQIPELSIRILGQREWRDGMKVEVLFKGKSLIEYDKVLELMEIEKKKAEMEKERADKNEKTLRIYAQKLRELGIKPEEL
ncbi:MAG: Uma2 family endonuclease [Leptospiraceae bacterium]|nr:Uma2 family endonuclease [Leptospiraceae bacterium]